MLVVVFDKIDPTRLQEWYDVVKRRDDAVGGVAAVINHHVEARSKHLYVRRQRRVECACGGCVRLDELHVAMLKRALVA